MKYSIEQIKNMLGEDVFPEFFDDIRLIDIDEKYRKGCSFLKSSILLIMDRHIEKYNLHEDMIGYWKTNKYADDYNDPAYKYDHIHTLTKVEPVKKTIEITEYIDADKIWLRSGDTVYHQKYGWGIVETDDPLDLYFNKTDKFLNLTLKPEEEKDVYKVSYENKFVSYRLEFEIDGKPTNAVLVINELVNRLNDKRRLYTLTQSNGYYVSINFLAYELINLEALTQDLILKIKEKEHEVQGFEDGLNYKEQFTNPIKIASKGYNFIVDSDENDGDHGSINVFVIDNKELAEAVYYLLQQRALYNCYDSEDWEERNLNQVMKDVIEKYPILVTEELKQEYLNENFGDNFDKNQLETDIFENNWLFYHTVFYENTKGALISSDFMIRNINSVKVFYSEEDIYVEQIEL